MPIPNAYLTVSLVKNNDESQKLVDCAVSLAQLVTFNNAG